MALHINHEFKESNLGLRLLVQFAPECKEKYGTEHSETEAPPTPEGGPGALRAPGPPRGEPPRGWGPEKRSYTGHEQRT